jgi:hypothetical protein
MEGASQTFLFYSPGDGVLVCLDENIFKKMLKIATVSVTCDTIDDFESNTKVWTKLLCG